MEEIPMNKSIASLALVVASSSYALIGPTPGGRVQPRPQPHHFCLSLHDDGKGNAQVGDCDETARNKMYKVKLNDNGCAENQAALESYSAKLRSCPTFVQL
jgi:hypothetical protein